MNADFAIPPIKNEIVKSYLPGSSERKSLQAQLVNSKNKHREIKMTIDGKKVSHGKEIIIKSPHDLNTTLGHHYHGTKNHVIDAVNAALKVKASWAAMPWQDRAAIFLKAADLLAGPYRDVMNAATMLCQSKKRFPVRDRCCG